MIALDTETTGVDLYHGCLPYLVTVCEPGKDPLFWEWDVDPLTREVNIIPEDVGEVCNYLAGHDLVLHNAKFDFTALKATGWDIETLWPNVYDTLLAGHLLHSNRPKDLTAMATMWLGIDIKPLEDVLEMVCKDARKLVKKKKFIKEHGDWLYSREGLAGMPSVKGSTDRDEEKPWKNDTWLPRTVARLLGYPKDHPWWTVASNYANGDSKVTAELWPILRDEIKRRGLWKIYEARRKLLPIAWGMEQRGVILNRGRLNQLTKQFTEESIKSGQIMTGIAAGHGFELTLPKNGANGSLRTFCFDHLKLEPVRNPKAKTDAPTLDAKNAIPYYLATLSVKCEQRTFIEELLKKRAYDTGLSFMESYQKFWRPAGRGPGWYVINPRTNPTGTDTLRWSLNNPNTQQISKGGGEHQLKPNINLRRIFGPGPGREWWSLDYKNVELRIPAYESGERDLIALFEEPDAPPYYGSQHILNFSTVYPEIWERAVREVGLEKAGPYCKKTYVSSWYQWVKNGDFAIQYQCGQRTADQAFHMPGAFAALKSRFAKQEALNQHYVRFADKHGYVETLPDRTVDPHHGYPLLCTRTEYGRILSTIPLSYHVQGTAMWETGMAMINVQGQLDDWFKTGFDARIVIQQHDEMVFDFPRGAHPKEDPKRSNLGRVRVIQRLMELCGANLIPAIPTPVGVEYHPDNWGEGLVC